ncbi:Putative protein phosphatase 2C-type (plasmid) [Rhodococcoides fascians D188]|nr:protein phosphatase 2C domain-containing protein [Rhodococcus fascians]AMY56337.1 Putative protein phosphatase 2C-type [Rhodococcus fascians D188]
MVPNSSPVPPAKIGIREALRTRIACAALWIVFVAVLVFGVGRIDFVRDNAALAVFLVGSVVPLMVWRFAGIGISDLKYRRERGQGLGSQAGASWTDREEQTEHDPFDPVAQSQAASPRRDDRNDMSRNLFDFHDERRPERTPAPQPFGPDRVLRQASPDDFSAPRATVNPDSLTVTRHVPLGGETDSVQSEMTDIGVPPASRVIDRGEPSTSTSTRGGALDRLFGRSTDRIDTEESTVGRILSFPGGGGGALFFDADSATDAGPRKENQDWAILSGSLLGIADGVGGRSAGGQASRAALRAVRDAIEEDGMSLASAVTRANTDVRARQDDDPADRGRATTLDIVHLDETGYLYGAHVGDSRVYILPARGRRLRRLTADHSTGNTLTRSIGGARSVTPDVWAHEAEPGDIVLVATDGLWKGSLHENDIESTLVEARQRSTIHIAERLVEIAKTGATDNITVIVGRIQRA